MLTSVALKECRAIDKKWDKKRNKHKGRKQKKEVSVGWGWFF